MSLHLTKKTISSFIFAMLFLLVPAAIDIVGTSTQRFFLDIQSAEDFFYYYDLTPVKTVYSAEEELRIKSDSVIKRQISIEWNDILFCEYKDDPGYYVNVGSTEDPHFENSERDPEEGTKNTSNNISPRPREENVWVWNGDKPSSEAECYIEANVRASVGLGITKYQTIESDKFIIQ